VLNRRGFSTLLFDLLTPQEDRDTAARFDVPRLARRLDAAVQWARQQPALRDLPRGLFGASTGAAAALMVAAARPDEIGAVVSRGGRPDLADASSLSRVQAPTLLIVGGADVEVLELNRVAQAAMPQGASLTVVPGATHLFEEPGALEQVAAIAADWFARWL
jgi:dienelactone hydrolase